MNQTTDILQLKYEELVKEFSVAYPVRTKDENGKDVTMEFVSLQKEVRSTNSYIKLGFVPIFQHVEYEADIIKAENKKVVRMFQGSFTPIRYIPYSKSKYQPHQGSKEKARRVFGGITNLNKAGRIIRASRSKSAIEKRLSEVEKDGLDVS